MKRYLKIEHEDNDRAIGLSLQASRSIMGQP
jgi:hypothetical protein